MEGNDQESIHLPSTFRPRHEKERRTYLKQRTTIKTLQAESQKDSFFQKKKKKKNGQPAVKNKNFTRTYMQRHTMTETVNHSRNLLGFDAPKADKYNVTNETFVIGRGATI